MQKPRKRGFFCGYGVPHIPFARAASRLKIIKGTIWVQNTDFDQLKAEVELLKMALLKAENK